MYNVMAQMSPTIDGIHNNLTSDKTNCSIEVKLRNNSAMPSAFGVIDEVSVLWASLWASVGPSEHICCLYGRIWDIYINYVIRVIRKVTPALLDANWTLM